MIRAAQLSDVPALVRLETLFPSDQLSARNFRHLLTRGHAQVLVATEHGALIGNVVLLFRRGRRAARVYSLVVHPDFQRRGVARALLQAAEAEAQRRGYTQLSLEVRADNAPALGLYTALGYDAMRWLPGFYADGTAAQRLLKPLGP